MVAQSIDQLKQDWTDRYVVVDAARPELARFRDVVGQVKTVNMSGRALIEFLDYHVNIGWYDIDVDYLKVVDKPPAKVEKPKAEKKPAEKAPAAKGPAAEAASPAAGAKPTPTPAKAAGKPSVADILAAARGGKGAPAKAPAGEVAAATGQTAAPATAPAAAKPAPPKVDRSKMSVADMLAAARAGGAAGSAPKAAAPVAKTQVEDRPGRAEAATPQEEVEPEAVEVAKPVPAAAPVAKSTVKIDKSKMSIDDMLAWCRAHDAK
jgi:hypothetical protein